MSICFVAEIQSRGLVLPEDLYEELRQQTLAPFVFQDVLFERLVKGAKVLDEHGDINAPDELWLLWEAIFVAWWCCVETIRQVTERGRRRTRAGCNRAKKQKTGPRFEFS